MKRFFQITLRTTDVDAAEDFYAAVLGVASVGAVPLPERAVARGAVPHWMGFLDVGEVEPALAEVHARGGTALGPRWTRPGGLEAAFVRDPGGAILALAKPAPAPDPAAGPEVAFYTLDTQDVEGAKAMYGALFGWSFGAPIEVGEQGTFHPFAFAPGAPEVGVFGDVARRPGIHPHWTYFFAVDALDDAVARVESGGGVSLGVIVLPNGDRICVCDDPQGAAFALYETR